MRTVKGWWFGTTRKTLAHNDNRPIVIGATHTVDGEIIPCQYGLHLSTRIIDALKYAPGPVIYRVQGAGVIVPHGDPTDKYAFSKRTYLAGGIDISDTLLAFARKCALDVVHLWNAPEIVVQYLETGDESIRDAAWDAAWDASGAAARAAARAAAWDAARAAAWDAAWAAAEAAARAAVRDAAWDAARAAVRDAAWAAAWDAAWAAARAAAEAAARAAAEAAARAAVRDAAWAAAEATQNNCLTAMVSRLL